ncbi:SDR family oxidoreductase [Alteromonas sp. ASW11-130]|uniref:SDR family oxidoreductase n=1 Tax=Alteromonas sp. ASW11-130 TaxID=3015775 RepID=UPI00224231D7|nr:SDR family oxidoreductase [Alteromonas sp. ASW11-130]MCW8091509.1 SDR family oxidoreductase [Alteromonas sp. ASW11-130]
MKTIRLLITGGATGFGKAMALCWVKHAQQDTAIKVCIADIHQQRGEETVAELKKLGAEAFYSQCDITVEADIAATRDIIQERWQGVDIVINNAGVATGGSLNGESLEQWEWVFNINLFGMVKVSQAFVDVFRKQGQGYFINVASQAGVTPIPLMGSYNAVKAAVVSFSETMKTELAPENIDVSVVCPSFFKTNLDESMRTSEQVMRESIKRQFNKADMTAEEVAEKVWQQAQKRNFLMLTHKSGKAAYYMKKWLPIDWYLNKIIKATKKMVLRAREGQGENG